MQTRVLILFMIIISASCKPVADKNNRQTDIHQIFNPEYPVNPVELLYIGNEYYLFYRYNETIDSLEISRLGLVKSPDLVHWSKTETDDEAGRDNQNKIECIVKDWNNTSALAGDASPLIAVAKKNDPVELPNEQIFQLVYSTDNGNNWSDSGREITLNNCPYPPKDIKIIWSEERQKWIMLMLAGYEIKFYSSDNLVDWEYESTYGKDIYSKTGDWTHLDFFPLEILENHQMMWILLISGNTGSPNGGSGIQYFVGDFDGYSYHSTHNKPKWIDNGSDLDIGIVLSDYQLVNQPAWFMGRIANSRYDQIALNTRKANGWSFARKLTLKEKYNDHDLCAEPHQLIHEKQKANHAIKSTKFSGELKINKKQTLPLEINLRFDANNRTYLDFAEVFGIELSNEDNEKLVIGYHTQRRYFFISDPRFSQNPDLAWSGFDYAPYVIDQPEIKIKIILDRSGIELFAMDGQITLTRKNINQKDWDKISLFSEHGYINLLEGNIVELN